MAVLESQTVPVGWEVADFQLKNTDEKTVSPKDFADKKGLLVVFTCNHCPYAKAAWPLLIDLYHRYKDEIAFVGVNPNDEERYPDDSFEEMKKKKVEWEIPFDYLRDETQEVAKTYKAQCTPDPYLFKNDGGVFKLFYHGRINDNWQDPQNIQERNLEDAASDLLSEKEPPVKQPSSMGCSIKWK